MGTKDEAIILYLTAVLNNGLSKSDYDDMSELQKLMVEKKGDKYLLSSEYRSLFSVALTGGVFDIIHPGHIYTLLNAKKQADLLIVVLATDDTVRVRKGRPPLHLQDERLQLVNSLKPVDLAIIGGNDWKETYERVSPDVVVFGYDQDQKQIDGVKIVQLKKSIDSPNAKTSSVRDKLGL
jgi:FAD synthetase